MIKSFVFWKYVLFMENLVNGVVFWYVIDCVVEESNLELGNVIIY